MALSPIIEFLLSQNRPTGGRLCHSNRLQFQIPFIPPNTQFTWALSPPSNAYAAIKYAYSVGSEVIPNTVYTEATQGGDMYVVGFIASDWIANVIDYFIIFTEAQPIYTNTINYSTLAQCQYGTQWNVLIPSEEDYEEIMHRLDAYAARASERLQMEANSYLKEMVKKQPISGGRR